MRKLSRTTWTAALCVAMAMSGVAYAKKGGNGGGKPGGDDDGGPRGGATTPVKITFVDELGLAGNRISGDGLGAYEHDVDGGGDGVEAYLGGGGARGDIFFRLGNAPSRGLFLNFEDCHPDPGSCALPPNPSGVDLLTSIAVAPGDVGYSDGLFGMAPDSEIHVPMEVFYAYDPEIGPGFIHFESGLKGNNPCKNKSLHVTVTRPGEDDFWIVSADSSVLACVRLPGGGGLSGEYLMPFQFTVEPLP